LKFRRCLFATPDQSLAGIHAAIKTGDSSSRQTNRVRHGEFRIDQPFLDLPNVIAASPHNSAQGGGAHDISLRRAVENCRRALTGDAPLHVIGLDERLI
jgi:hypothetical protein